MTEKPGYIYEEVKSTDDLVKFENGQLTITKAKATDTAKEYFVVAYPEKKDYIDYAKKSIKI